MILAGNEFNDKLYYYVNVWWPARSIVEKCLKKRFEVRIYYFFFFRIKFLFKYLKNKIHESGSVMVLERYAPWKDHLFTLEKDMNLEKDAIKYVLFEDASKSWRIQCVPANQHSFNNRLVYFFSLKLNFNILLFTKKRLSLPEEWRGLRDAELSKVADISDCIFVHASGFIGGAKSYASVIEMAKKSLLKLC